MVFLQSPEPCEPSCSLCAKLMRNNVDTSPVVLRNELTGESKIVPQYAVRGYLSMWSPFYEYNHAHSRFLPFLVPLTRPISIGASSTGSSASLSSLDHSAAEMSSSPLADIKEDLKNERRSLRDRHQSTSPDGRAFPVKSLTQKARFCSIVESTECLRCQRLAAIDGSSHSSSTGSRHHYDNNHGNGGGAFSLIGGGGGSDGYSSARSCTSLSSSLSNMSLTSKTYASLPSTTRKSTTGSSDGGEISPKTCSFCYGQHKKHLQNLNLPWPRIQDAGPWHGHNIKDEDGTVKCPELFRLMCPLCFATGAEAHTVKFCPLNTVS